MTSPLAVSQGTFMFDSLIKEFEQEARMDGMPAAELTSRKKVLVQQLNDFIAKKKEHGNDIAGRKELIGAAKRGDIPKDTNSEGSHDRLYDLHQLTAQSGFVSAAMSPAK